MLRALKRHQYEPDPVLQIGTVVQVHATKGELQKHVQLGPWTARGIVHGITLENEYFYIIRWISVGVGSAVTRKHGHLSRGISRLSVRPLFDKNGETSLAIVYRDDEGSMVITDRYDGGLCRCVYIDGPSDLMFKDTNTIDMENLDYTPYEMWVVAKRAEAKGYSEEEEVSGKRKKPAGKYKQPKRQTTEANVRPPPDRVHMPDDPIGSVWQTPRTSTPAKSPVPSGIYCFFS